MTRDPLDTSDPLRAAVETLRDAPPPPPFARVATAIETAPRRSLPNWAVATFAGAAAACLLAVGLSLQPAPRDPEPGPLDLPRDAGLSLAAITVPGEWQVEAREATAVPWRDGSARMVLDGGTGVLVVSPDHVIVRGGRTWFEVRPGRPADRPFVVSAGAAKVRVKGTSFEVALADETLTVQVASGVVEVAGASVPAGKRWRGGEVEDADPFPGAWFRTPRLALDVPARAAPGAPVALTARFENPGHVPFDLQRRSGAPATLWLSVRAPDGAVHDVPLGADDGWEPGDPLPLGARETVRVPVRLLRPFASPGSYRVTALYRPSDGPSVRSDEVVVEVR